MVLGSLAFTTKVGAQTNPAELWPIKIPAPAEAGTLEVRVGKLEAALAAMPTTLGPAVKFEETFLRLMAAGPKDEWLPTMQTFATATANDPVTGGVRDLARAWVARAEMDRIGTMLDQFYGENVRYPATFAEVEKRLSAGSKLDPWGEAWVYRPHAPKGFAQQAGQRYELGPKRDPHLGTLRDAVGGGSRWRCPRGKSRCTRRPITGRWSFS